MAGGNLGELWFSMDIRGKVEDKIRKYEGEIKNLNDLIGNTEFKINEASEALGKMAKGSDAWNKQKEGIQAMFRVVNDLIRQTNVYEEALGRVQKVQIRLDKGGLLGPSRKITSFQDTKPLEEAISKYEKIETLLTKLSELQQRKPSNVMDFVFSDRAGNKNMESYTAAMETYRKQISNIKAELKSLGGENLDLRQVRSQLDSLYGTLYRFDEANRRAASSSRESRSEEQRRAQAIKDARIAFEPLIAAQAREEAQERANRANIEATNAARQKQVQSLREQAEAMMRSKLSMMESQRSSLGRMYSQGKALGMDPSDLDAIINKYKELSREILNFRTMLQDASAMSYNSMFAMGRFSGSGASYVRDTSEQVSSLRSRLQESVYAARDLASAFNRVHESALRSSQVLSDIKSIFLQGGIVFAAQQFANSVIQTGGDIVQQHIALRSIIGDVQKADELFHQTQQLALQSPFKFQELNRDVKQLAAFGVEADKLYDTSKRLADVSAGLGVSFERLGLAYGQVKARSWLDGKELRQFAYAGLPMLQKIADLYNETGKNGRRNYTTSDIRNMITKRQVSFEDVDAVFKKMTDAGGQFYNMQFVLSETLLGRWNKLMDAWSIMLGKLADGNNVIGKFFSTAIDGATSFLLQLDKISPVLVSVGAVFGGKKVFGAAMGAMGLGLGNFSKEMQLAERSVMKAYSAKQMQLVMEKEITAQEAEQNILSQRKLLSDTSTKNLTYLQLAAEGKLSAMQIGQLAKRGQLTAETINELRAMGAINEQQAVLLNQLREEYALRQGTSATMMKYGVTSIGSKIESLFSPGNIAMIGSMVGMSLWMGYSQWSSKVKEDIRTISDASKQNYQKYEDFISAQNGSKESLSSRVDAMKELLQSSDEYTDTIKEQVENAKGLQEQFNILKSHISDLRDTNKSLSGSYGQVLANAYNETGLEKDRQFGDYTPRAVRWFLGLTNDDIGKNVEQAQQSLQKYQMMFDTLDENTQKSMENFIQGLAAKNSKLADTIKGMPVSEQIRILAFTGGDDWEAFVKRFSNGSEEVENWLSDLSKRAKDSSDDIAEITQDDVPKILDSMREQLGMSQKDFSIWCAKNPKLFSSMMDAMAKKANITSKEILKWFHRTVSELLNFNFWPDDNGGGKHGNPVYRSGVDSSGLAGLIRRRLTNSRTRKVRGGFYWSELDQFLRGVQDSSWEKTAQNILNEYKTYRNEMDVLNSSHANKNSAYYKSTARNLSIIKAAMEVSGITDDIGKNKTTGNFAANKIHAEAQKADNATLRALQARLKLINEAYSIYKQYYEKLHDEDAAAAIVRSSFAGRGLSNDDVSKIKTEAGLRSLVEDYVSRVRNTQFKLPSEMKDRKDEAISAGIEKEKDIDFRIMEESMDNFANGVSNTLNDMSRKWEAYQNIWKATGNAGLAASVSGFGSSPFAKRIFGNEQTATGFVLRYSDFLESYLDNIVIPYNKVIDYNKVANMSDTEIEKYAGSMLAGKDSSKVSGLIVGLKKVRDILVDKEYQEGMNTFAELMDKIVTSASEVDRANADNQSKLSNLMNANLSPEKYKQAKEILDAEHDDALLKASDEYKQFMNFVGAMTKSGVTNMYEKALLSLDRRYKDGIISLKEYTDGITQLDDQMQKYNDIRSNTYAAFTGGLNGLFQNMITKGAATGNTKMVAAGKSGVSSVAIVDAIVNGINNNVQAYKNLENTWTESFGNGLKNSKFGSFMGGFTEASQGAADAWNNLKSGNFVGVLDGVVRSFTGWFSWGNAAANKRWQEQATYLKGLQSTLNKINSNLESRISSKYGSQAITSAKEYQENLRTEASEVRQTAYDWSQAHSIKRNHRNRVYVFGGKGETKSAFSTINETLRANGYAGPEIGGDNIQDLEGKWLEMIRDKHAGLWGKMDEDLRGYLETLIDIESETGSTKKATEKLAETLSGLSVEGLQSDYESLIESFEATNTDFADDFEKKLKKAILSSMVSNLYKNQIENLVQNSGGLGQNKDYLSKNGTVKQHAVNSKGEITYNENDIASEYTPEEYEKLKEEYTSLGDSINDTAKMLQEAFGWKSGSANSTSSSIKGMTEQTADLLASYLNAIRADVSVIRQLTIPDLDSINMTAKAQLQQLNQIAANTALNADIAGRMETAVSNMNGILESVKNGTKTLSVKVQ